MARRSGASRSGVLAMIIGATSTSTISNVVPMTNRLNQLALFGAVDDFALRLVGAVAP